MAVRLVKISFLKILRLKKFEDIVHSISMKEILLLTDFSKNAKEAIEYAIQFFEGTACRFHLLHVVKTSKYITGTLMAAPATSTVFDGVIKKAKEDLQAYAQQLTDRNEKSHEFLAVTDYDNFIDAVNQLIETEQISMVVMGTNGKTSAKEKIFGSHTIQVFRNVNVPVLAIPEDTLFKDLQQFLIVLENQSSPVKLKRLSGLVDMGNAKITLANTSPKSEKPVKSEVIDNIHNMFPTAKIKWLEIARSNTENELKKVLPGAEFDMAIFIGGKKTFVQRLLKGSPAKMLIYDTPFPLLLIS